MNWKTAGDLLVSLLGWVFSFLQKKREKDAAQRTDAHLKREEDNEKILSEINAPSMDPSRTSELLSVFDPSEKGKVPPASGT